MLKISTWKKIMVLFSVPIIESFDIIVEAKADYLRLYYKVMLPREWLK